MGPPKGHRCWQLWKELGVGEPKVPLPALTWPEAGPSPQELGTELHPQGCLVEPAPHRSPCHLGKATPISIPVDTRPCGQEWCRPAGNC